MKGFGAPDFTPKFTVGYLPPPDSCLSVAFNDTMHGETCGMFIADAESYGAEKLWVLLKGIPIELDGDDEDAE